MLLYYSDELVNSCIRISIRVPVKGMVDLDVLIRVPVKGTISTSLNKCKISIRASVKDTMYCRLGFVLVFSYFNPRTREGCDLIKI